MNAERKVYDKMNQIRYKKVVTLRNLMINLYL